METNFDEDFPKNTRIATILRKGELPDLSEKEVDDAIQRLGRLLGVRIATRQADVGAGRPVFATMAERDGRTVVFSGNETTGKWKAVISLVEWNSRHSFLKYALEDAVQMSTCKHALRAIHARTIEELEMKASICGGMKWRENA